MQWLKLEWDEGPFRQTDRFDVYRSYVDKLLKEGKAYYCCCTLKNLSKEEKKRWLRENLPNMMEGAGT